MENVKNMRLMFVQVMIHIVCVLPHIYIYIGNVLLNFLHFSLSLSVYFSLTYVLMCVTKYYYRHFSSFFLFIHSPLVYMVNIHLTCKIFRKTCNFMCKYFMRMICLTQRRYGHVICFLHVQTFI